MEITTKSMESEIQVFIQGRIDTSTSTELQNEIMKSFQKAKNVVLDFTEVAYISSAGLRALLLGHKTAIAKGGSLKILNISSVVREVFEVTGFLKILNVE